jgi:hypothetical protein
MESIPSKGNTMGEVKPLRPFTWDGQNVWVGKRTWGGITKPTKRKNLCQGLTPTKRCIGTSTFKSYGKNLKTFKLHTWSKGAQSL